MEDSFRNPFSDYNANVMDTNKILDYWCSPFAFFKLPVSEEDIYRHAMPIVFMGGRGTGKTMFLKYFSYHTQRDEALREADGKNRRAVMSYLQSRGGIGFYLRFDGPMLRSFEGKGVAPEAWDAIFTQYFELQVCKSYVEVILDLVKREQVDQKGVEEQFVPRVAERLGRQDRKARRVEDILNMVEDALEEITTFRAKIGFSDVPFVPSQAFASQDLSFGVVEIARETIEELRDGLNFVVLLDEYENYLARQQVVVNTLLKFVRAGITFRIGMRLQGFHTFATISANEFIMEGRDYSKYVFEDILVKDSDYRRFLTSVARKRLETVPIFKENKYLNISNFLGHAENLEEEAANLVKGEESKTRHFALLEYSDLSKSGLDKQSIDNVRGIIAKPDNPLLEMLNILWMIRGNGAHETKEAMKGYLDRRVSNPLAKKYKRDYADKYKLSLMFLLSSVYRKRKLYYSFNTFCFLSSGIVGNFIELCRKSFQYAYFENRDALLQKGAISNELQDRAARDLADTQLEMTSRIQTYGRNLYFFAKNLGNVFAEYHKDPLVRYPETNQFTLDASATSDGKLMEIFHSAVEWSIVQKKSTLQQRTPGAPRTDIYTLNRVFSPTFDLTYRTRGGYSMQFDASYLEALMTQDSVRSPLDSRKKAEPKEGFQPGLGLK
jgi:hypothetical protein